MPVVVVDADQPVRQPVGEARVVEHPVAARWPIAPHDLAFARELHNAAGTRIVGREIEVGAELLRIRRVGDG